MNTTELSKGFDLLAQDHPNKTIFIIGGPRLLKISRNFIETALVTHYNSDYDSDAVLDVDSWFENTTVLQESLSNNKIFRKYECRPI